MPKCYSCRRSFDSLYSLNQHLGASSRHANCDLCRQGFGSIRQFKNHYYESHASDLALQRHGQRRIVAASNASVPSPQLAVVSASAPYNGVPRELVMKVFRIACQLRSQEPTPELIIAESRTNLHHEIVSAILEAALRLLPPDNTPDGIQLRRDKAAEKARKAEEAESGFIHCLRKLDPRLLCEAQLQEQIRAAQDAGTLDTVRLTPDALLSQTTLICGKLCAWVEYKNTFGFRSSPFVAGKNKAQYRKYALEFGPGMVVYKLGYENNHVQIEGVYCFREAEVVQWIDSQ